MIGEFQTFFPFEIKNLEKDWVVFEWIFGFVEMEE